MTDKLRVRYKGGPLRLQKGKPKRIPFAERDGAAIITLDRTVVVEAGKLITIKGTAVIQGEKPKPPPVAAIPRDDEWTPRGTVLRPSRGEWDARFKGHHSTSDAIVLPDGSVALYYVGAKGDRKSDGGPAFRALGVAISEDGLKPFEKYRRNPIVTYIDEGSAGINQEEEGVFTCAVVQAGEIIWLFYGAIEATGPGSVDVFTHVAQSTNGIHFTNHKRIPGIATSRGELWPFSAVHIGGVFYLWLGRRDRIDMISGTDPYKLRHQLKSGLRPHNERELGTSVVHLGRGNLAALYDDPMRVAKGTTARWRNVRQYSVPEGDQGKCWLIDRSRNRWLLYVTSKDNKSIKVWTAPIRG